MQFSANYQNYRIDNKPPLSIFDAEITNLNSRITNLEKITSELAKENFRKENNEENSSKFSNEEEVLKMTNPYIEEIENDSYLFLSIVLSYNSAYLSLKYACQTLCSKNISFLAKVYNLAKIFLIPFLLFPGISTPIVQISAFYFLYQETLTSLTSVDLDRLLLLKLFLIIVFGFMIAKEASQAINGIFYSYFEANNKKIYFFSGCYFPQIIQLLMTISLLYISILLMMSTDDSVDLLQNFAALYIVIDLDMIMMDFLRLTKFNLLLIKIDKYFREISKILREKMIYKQDLISMILFQKTIEINYEDKSKASKTIFILSRIFVILFLIIFGVLICVFEVYRSIKEEE